MDQSEPFQQDAQNNETSDNKYPFMTVHDPTQSVRRKRSNRDSSITQVQKKRTVGRSGTPNEAERAVPTELSRWEDWDVSRTGAANQTISAARVWRNLSTNTEVRSTQRNCIVTMVLAVGDSHAFHNLKNFVLHLQRSRAENLLDVQHNHIPPFSDAFSTDPKVLFQAIEAIGMSDNFTCYMRRCALARLAQIYRDACANDGELSGEKDTASTFTSLENREKSYESLIQHIWNLSMPQQRRGNQKRLLDSKAPEVILWEQRKRQMKVIMQAGKRWLSFMDRFGDFSLGLVSNHWVITKTRSIGGDYLFEKELTNSEFEVFLEELEHTKGEFLRSLNRVVGGLGFFQNSHQLQKLPLLRLDDVAIFRLANGAPEWIEWMRSE